MQLTRLTKQQDVLSDKAKAQAEARYSIAQHALHTDLSSRTLLCLKQQVRDYSLRKGSSVTASSTGPSFI